MCTLALFFKESEDYPLIVAANRDEFFARPSAPPQLLAKNPKVLGGKDLLAGGTWLGVNEHGMLAGILNRRSEERKEQAALRSRGLFCMDVLNVKNPPAARAFLRNEKGSIYRPFNLLFANAEEAYIAYNQGEVISWIGLEKGLHVFSNGPVSETQSEKMGRAYLLFSQVRDALLRKEKNLRERIPYLRTILSDHASARNSDNPKDSICVHMPAYGTVSSTVIFYARAERRFYSYHTSGPPCKKDYGQPLCLEVL